MSDLLKKICADKLEFIAAMKAVKPLAALEAEAKQASPVRGFTAALRKKIADGKFGIIAEIKKASPSAGQIRPDFSPADLARAYTAGGAACLSVLTDQPYFQGENLHLQLTHNACPLPVLRKDFMLDPYQVVEARAIGADCILLIMAALSDMQAQELHAAATANGMDILIETHDAIEMERALALPSGMIGINNRNLKTLAIDLAVTEKLSGRVPSDRLMVSESGLSTRADLERMARVGAHGFLVGESLLKQGDVTQALRQLIS
jgi:indole-3-glycerol phosphate synthase